MNNRSHTALVLLSGGLDSATALAVARDRGFRCHTLAIDYGQRHRHELHAAQRIARYANAHQHHVLSINLRAVGGSALTDNIDVPKHTTQVTTTDHIPVTYVPARNLIFLSLAVAKAEALRVSAIFIGVNAIDYSGYPDCRREFIHAFQHTANLATKAATQGHNVTIETPLIHLTKAQIIQLGTELGVDYAQTLSCYDPNPQGLACAQCDACILRNRGFQAAGIQDPTRYATEPPET